MKNAHAKHLMLMAAALLVLALGACGPAAGGGVATAMTEEQVMAIAENMLQGYSAGDYAAFSRDWAPVARTLISEQTFQDLRDEALAATGEFVAIESVEVQPTESEGHSRWSVTARFQNTTETFSLTFDESSGRIEGLDFGPFS